MWRGFCDANDGNIGNGQRKANKKQRQERYVNSILSNSDAVLTFGAVQMNRSTNSTKNSSNWWAARKSPFKKASQLRFGKPRRTPTLFSVSLSATRRMKSPARKTTITWEMINGTSISLTDEVCSQANNFPFQLAQSYRSRRSRLRSCGRRPMVRRPFWLPLRDELA
jgi:hypothetical protein